MYFLDSRSQDDIARVLGTSRSNVSRMLGIARTLGIVEIRIQDQLGRNADLEQALAERFDLAHVRVAVFRPRQDPWLQRALWPRSGSITRSGTDRSSRCRRGASVEAVVSAAAVDGLCNVEVVPLVGGLATGGSPWRARSSSASSRLGSERRTAACTAGAAALRLRAGRAARRTVDRMILERARSADIALVGIGRWTRTRLRVLEGLGLTDVEEGVLVAKSDRGHLLPVLRRRRRGRSAASCTTGCSRWILTTFAASRRWSEWRPEPGRRWPCTRRCGAGSSMD